MGYTIRDLRNDYPDDDACLEAIFADKYGSDPSCPKCGKSGFSRVSGRKCFACNWCGHQLHPIGGTIFHKSSTPLTLWFHALYLFSTSLNGVSAKELQRQLGVTYKTAWRMANRIRKLMDDGDGKMGGTVEVDETYIGGRRKGKRGRGAAGKTAVAGIAERGGRVEVRAVPNVRKATLMPLIAENVEGGATVMTDELASYAALGKSGYAHRTVRHSAGEFAVGDTHTNTIEGHWSLVKRSIRGTYVHVSRKFLQSYLDEFSFRRNHRKSETPIFRLLLDRLAA